MRNTNDCLHLHLHLHWIKDNNSGLKFNELKILCGPNTWAAHAVTNLCGPGPTQPTRFRRLCPSWNPTWRKSGCGPGLGDLPEIWGFPYDISATAEPSDFTFGIRLGFAKAHHKITSRGKSGHGLGLGELPKFWGSPIIFLQRLGLATSNLACSWGLARPMIKSHAEERVHMALG